MEPLGASLRPAVRSASHAGVGGDEPLDECIVRFSPWDCLCKVQNRDLSLAFLYEELTEGKDLPGTVELD